MGSGRPGRVAAAEVRAGARGRAGVQEAWDGAPPARAAQPARGQPRACHGCGQLPPLSQPADPVGTGSQSLLRRMEVRAGRAGRVGRTPPPTLPPRLRSGLPVRSLPSRGSGFLPSCSFFPSRLLSRLRDSWLRVPRECWVPWFGRPLRRFPRPGRPGYVTAVLSMMLPPPRGPLHVCSGAPTPPAPVCRASVVTAAFFGIWVGT